MGGEETMGASIGRNLPDALLSPPGVAMRASSTGSSGVNGGRCSNFGVRGGEIVTEDNRYGGGGRETQTKWEMVVELIQTEFREGELMEEAA